MINYKEIKQIVIDSYICDFCGAHTRTCILPDSWLEIEIGWLRQTKLHICPKCRKRKEVKEFLNSWKITEKTVETNRRNMYKQIGTYKEEAKRGDEMELLDDNEVNALIENIPKISKTIQKGLKKKNLSKKKNGGLE